MSLRSCGACIGSPLHRQSRSKSARCTYYFRSRPAQSSSLLTPASRNRFILCSQYVNFLASPCSSTKLGPRQAILLSREEQIHGSSSSKWYAVSDEHCPPQSPPSNLSANTKDAISHIFKLGILPVLFPGVLQYPHFSLGGVRK